MPKSVTALSRWQADKLEIVVAATLRHRVFRAAMWWSSNLKMKVIVTGQGARVAARDPLPEHVPDGQCFRSRTTCMKRLGSCLAINGAGEPVTATSVQWGSTFTVSSKCSREVMSSRFTKDDRSSFTCPCCLDSINVRARGDTGTWRGIDIFW